MGMGIGASDTGALAVPASIVDAGQAPVVRGRVAFELHCAPCHGESGEGGYLGPSARPRAIAGAKIDDVVRQVRRGGKEMPAFPTAVMSDGTLADLALYVHESLARPPGQPAGVGPPRLDPFSVGVVVWVALALFTRGVAALFAERRR